MRILFLSFYYYPDLSAGSFRATSLISELIKKLPENAEIELITTLPNRYQSFTASAPIFEVNNNLRIHRIELPEHSGGMLDQSKAFLTYAKATYLIAKDKKFDLVFATSSRLMTAALGAFIAKNIKSTLYLDIRDIFVDTIKDVLPKRIAWALTPIFSRLEQWTVGKAEKINLVSEGFFPYFKKKYPLKKYAFFTNGIDKEFIKIDQMRFTERTQKILNVVYAGNMGEGQGLHQIIPELANKLHDKVHFRLIGDGGKKQLMTSMLKKSGCTNVEILPPMRRSELINEYISADVLFLHLNDYDAFRKVLPSKLFEYAALGKPIWAGVAGYARKFITENIDNAVVFPPCDVDQAILVFENLQINTTTRSDFVKKYAREKIMSDMANDIIGTIYSS